MGGEAKLLCRSKTATVATEENCVGLHERWVQVIKRCSEGMQDCLLEQTPKPALSGFQLYTVKLQQYRHNHFYFLRHVLGESADDIPQQRPLLQQERTIPAFASDPLRTSLTCVKHFVF